MAFYIGKLGNSTLSAAEPFVVKFADGQFLWFATHEEAQGFLQFYHANPTARATNPGLIYSFTNGEWREQPEQPRKAG